MGNQEVVDKYEPLEEGLGEVTGTHDLPSLEVTLSKAPLHKSDAGYQEPIDDPLVTEVAPEGHEELPEFNAGDLSEVRHTLSEFHADLLAEHRAGLSDGLTANIS